MLIWDSYLKTHYDSIFYCTAVIIDVLGINVSGLPEWLFFLPQDYPNEYTDFIWFFRVHSCHARRCEKIIDIKQNIIYYLYSLSKLNTQCAQKRKAVVKERNAPWLPAFFAYLGLCTLYYQNNWRKEMRAVLCQLWV